LWVLLAVLNKDMSRLCFYELEEVGLSYLKLIGDVKKNIINIIIIIDHVYYIKKSICYPCII
jgi:hypothetical protein